MTTNVSSGDSSQLDAGLDPATMTLNPQPYYEEPTVSEQLHGMVIDNDDVADFLRELCEYSAALATVEGGPTLDCAVTLFRRRRALTGAGNSARAHLLNDVQERLGSGPCLTALEEERTVVLRDTLADNRWPDYAKVLVHEGVRSVLAVPLILDKGAAASINFFATTPDAFNEQIVANAEDYARQVQSALRLAVRIGVKQQIADDLQDAMKARTTIDLAVGVLMGQQRCSQDEAFGILSRAASSRNQKVRNVAEDLLAKLTDSNVETHFDD